MKSHILLLTFKIEDAEVIFLKQPHLSLSKDPLCMPASCNSSNSSDLFLHIIFIICNLIDARYCMNDVQLNCHKTIPKVVNNFWDFFTYCKYYLNNKIKSRKKGRVVIIEVNQMRCIVEAKR